MSGNRSLFTHNFEVVQGDYWPGYRLRFLDDDGTPTALTGLVGEIRTDYLPAGQLKATLTVTDDGDGWYGVSLSAIESARCPVLARPLVYDVRGFPAVGQPKTFARGTVSILPAVSEL